MKFSRFKITYVWSYGGDCYTSTVDWLADTMVNALRQFRNANDFATVIGIQ